MKSAVHMQIWVLECGPIGFKAARWQGPVSVVGEGSRGTIAQYSSTDCSRLLSCVSQILRAPVLWCLSLVESGAVWWAAGQEDRIARPTCVQHGLNVGSRARTFIAMDGPVLVSPVSKPW